MFIKTPMLLALLSATLHTSSAYPSYTLPPYTCGKASNTSHLTCGKPGHITAPMDITNDMDYEYQATSLDDCINLCRSFQPGGNPYAYNSAESPTCGSFCYDSTVPKSCRIFASSVKDQGFKHNTSSPVRFYDAGCYTCDKCVATLTNGDFSDGNFDPWLQMLATYPDGHVVQPNGVVSPGQGDSMYAYRGRAGRATNVDGDYTVGMSVITQRVDWCVGSTYNVSFWYKFQGPANAQFTVVFDEGAYEYDTKYTYLFPDLYKATTKVWTFMSANFTTRYHYGIMSIGLHNYNMTAGPATFHVSNVNIALVS